MRWKGGYQKNYLPSLLLLSLLFFEIGVLSFSNKEESLGEETKFSITTPRVTLLPGEEKYVEEELIIPATTYAISFNIEVEGKPTLVHHATLHYLEHDDLYCPDMPLVIYAIGSELRTRSHLPYGYGILLKKGDKIKLYGHLTNDDDKVRSDSLSIRINGSKTVPKELTPVFLSIVDNCDPFSIFEVQDYPIPGGISQHTQTMERPFVMPRDGRLIAWTGHIHTYGTSITLLKNGNVISQLTPIKNPRDDIDSDSVYLPGHLFLPSVFLRKGDVLDLKATYEKPRDLFYPGAMGIGYLVFDFSSP